MEAEEDEEGEKCEYFYRLIDLVFDLGTEVLQKLFKKDIPQGQTVEDFLNSKANVLKILKKRRVFNQIQIGILDATPPDVSCFDINMLYILISYFTYIQPPIGGWMQSSPLPSDRSPGAMLMSFRVLINEIAHLSKSKMMKSVFKMFWRRTENILVNLAAEISETEKDYVEEKIEEIKTKQLVEDPGSPNTTIIGQLQEEINLLKQKVGQQSDISVDVDTLNTLKNVETKLQGLKSDKFDDVTRKVEQQSDKVDIDQMKHNTNLPPEILRMDRRSVDLYLKALGEGKTEVHNIRVMVVGHFDVGKSTLTKRLLGEEVNISDHNSTEGIDVHVKICRVDVETGLWEVKSKGLHKDDSSALLSKVVQQFCFTSSNHDSLKTSDISGLQTSDTGSSLDVDPFSYAGNLCANPDAKCEGHEKAEKAGTSMNASRPSQIDTVGMDELKLLVQRDDSEDLSDLNKYADLSIWDFAGQYAFYGTHQIFLSPRSVYLLVIDLSKTIDSLVCDDTCSKDTDGENRMKISDFVEFWLQSIHFYTEEPGMVILVGTHADKLAQKDRKENVNRFFEGLRSHHLCDKPYFVCLSEYEFDIDNSKVDPNLKDLKEAIFNVAKSNTSTSHWGELKPAKWLTLERRLHEMRQKAVKIIERDKLEEENRRLSVPLTGDELDLFLKFQHACGLLLYFSEQDLKDYVILDPQWLIDAFKCFITADMFKKKNPKMLPLWKSFKRNAILTQEFIDLSWKQSKDGMFSDHKEHLLRLMEKLDIIAKPVTYREHGITDSRVPWISEGSYFTPCVLEEKTPRSLLDTKQISNSISTHKLCYTFVSGQASGFIPPAIFHRLIAACISTWQPRVRNTKTFL